MEYLKYPSVKLNVLLQIVFENLRIMDITRLA
jgi:hypothetical protein